MDFLSATREWRRLLGDEGVRASAAEIDPHARSTAPSAHRPLAVLRPSSRDEVVAAVRVAGEFGVPLHPVSRGCNWGYGDANPPGEGQVVVDLSRMNRILEVNAELAYAVVEPGVTQGQLWAHLREKKLPLWMDSTGAGPGASLVGNALDRGFGHTRYGDHFQTCCGLEIVLADGRVLETGFGRFPGARSANVFRYGVGPVLDGLFSQSNLGIVTRMALWLMPEPEAFCAFFFSAKRADELGAIIDRLAPLKREGSLQSAVHVANDLRALSARVQYPWDRAGGQVPLPPGLRSELRSEFGVGAWNGCGAITGPREVVAAIRRRVKTALKPWFHVFLDDRKLAAADRLGRTLGKLGAGRVIRERLGIARPVFEMLKGRPTTDAIRGTAWRVRKPLPPGELTNPLDIGAGLLWVSPVVPMTGADATRVMGVVEPIYARHGFDCLATLTLLTDRTLSCVTNIAYDRAEPDDVVKAKLCYEELISALLKEGYVPYRTGPTGAAQLRAWNASSTFSQVNAEIKAALDPKGVFGFPTVSSSASRWP